MRRFEGKPRVPRKTRSRYVLKRKVCAFCVDKVSHIDYKEPSRLHRYVSDRGRIESRSRTGVCAKHQRALAQAIKRARHLALLPYTLSHIQQAKSAGQR